MLRILVKSRLGLLGDLMEVEAVDFLYGDMPGLLILRVVDLDDLARNPL